MKNSFNFYLIHTPLHYLNAIVYSSINNGNDSILFFVEDFENSDVYREILEAWEFNPFLEIISLRGREKGTDQNKLTLLKDIKYNIKKIQSTLNKYKDAVSINISVTSIVFHDGNPEGQYLQFNIRKLGGTNYYFQDGIDVYNDKSFLPQYNFLIKILFKILIGRWYVKTDILGVSPYTDKILMRRPNLVRKQLMGSEIIELNVNTLQIMAKRYPTFVTNLISMYNVSLPEKINMILLLPLSLDFEKYSISKNQIVKRIENLVESLKNKSLNIAVKFHPREQWDYINISRVKDITIIPRTLSLELVLIKYINDVQTLLGPNSTGLISAKMINPNIDVYLINEYLFQDFGGSLNKIYQKFSINNFNSIKQINI